MRATPGAVPFLTPLAVEPAPGFATLRPEHAALAVRSAPEAAAAFSAPTAAWPEARTAWAELQLEPLLGGPGRLGSGRAAQLGGVYIKGIGRTPLASGWREPWHEHNTGHLAASAGIREMVASRVAAAAGAGGAIVPCEGLLLAPLDPRLAAYARPEGRARHPVDAALQALTVKPGGSVRLSNLAWWASRAGHHPRQSALRLDRLLAFLTGGDGGSETWQPEAVASKLCAAFAQVPERFVTWAKAGLYWCSYYNNLTIDGRMLDLETPVFLGGPFFGQLSPQPAVAFPPAHQPILPGAELLFAAHELRTFCAFFASCLAFQRDAAPGSAVRDRIAALHALWTGESGWRAQWFADRRRAVERCLDAAVEAGALTPSERAGQRPFVEAEHDAIVDQAPYPRLAGAWTRVARLGPLPLNEDLAVWAHAPTAEAAARGEAGAARAAIAGDALRQLYAMTEPERIFDGIRALERALGLTPAPASPASA